MFRRLFESDISGVGFLASANVGLQGAGTFFQQAEPIMHFLLAIGQILVALATVIFIVRKIRQLPPPTQKRTRRSKKNED